LAGLLNQKTLYATVKVQGLLKTSE